MLPIIDPYQETKKITDFIKKILNREKFSNVVIGLSGGIDSTTVFFLLRRILPEKNIFPIRMDYQKRINPIDRLFETTEYRNKNICRLDIVKAVDRLKDLLSFDTLSDDSDRIRLGNIMARIRMIILFDLAKKNHALVCGTENRSENLLGYFTRFGDQASDLEPIGHLYKTQVYELAEYLKVPKDIIEQKPTAGLWKNQTDEKEFGFSYKEADPVLHHYFDKKMGVDRIKKLGFANAEKIIRFALNNQIKHHTPYTI